MPKLNQTRFQKYVADDGKHCPICKTGEIYYDDCLFPESGGVSVILVCSNCGAEVVETYTIKWVSVDRNTERQYGQH